MIRIPIDIRGRKGIDFGTNLTTGYHCRLESYSKDGGKVLFFGDGVQMGDFVHINARNNVWIGDNVLFASKIFVTDIAHGSYKGVDNDSIPESIVKDRDLSASPVKIGNNCWIGELVSILPGVTIGENCVIGAGSVVTKSIPANCIAVGNPARVIKRFNFTLNKWEKV